MKQVVPTFKDPEEVNCKAAEAKEVQEVNGGTETVKETAGVK